VLIRYSVPKLRPILLSTHSKPLPACSSQKVWIDDMYYEGGWKDSMMHGKGVCHQNEVDVMEGLFEEDELVG